MITRSEILTSTQKFPRISGIETHLVMLTFAILHDRLYSFAVKGRDKDVGYFVMP